MLKLNVPLDLKGTGAARVFTMSLSSSSKFHLFDHEATGSLTQMDASYCHSIPSHKHVAPLLDTL